VERVWGFEKMTKCIPYDEYEGLVIQKLVVLYEDDESYSDYSVCPITRGDDSKWICGDESKNPAGESSDLWFEKARNSTNLCERIINYCIAVDFFVNQYHPLHHTRYYLPTYYDKLNSEVEAHILAQNQNWSVEKPILFSHYENLTGVTRKARYHQKFTIKHSDYMRALDDAVEKGKLIRAYDYAETPTTTLPKKPRVTLKNLSQPTTIPTKIILERKSDIESKIALAFTILILSFIAGMILIYYKPTTKTLEEEEAETNLFKLPGASKETVDKLLSADIESIQNLMEISPKKMAEKTGVSVDEIKALKQSQRRLAKNFFQTSCPLSMQDLTSKQKETVEKHKKHLNKMMAAYRRKEKVSAGKQAQLDEIMQIATPEQANQLKRLIDGAVRLDEDLPYRILVDLAEKDLLKIKKK